MAVQSTEIATIFQVLSKMMEEVPGNAFVSLSMSKDDESGVYMRFSTDKFGIDYCLLVDAISKSIIADEMLHHAIYDCGFKLRHKIAEDATTIHQDRPRNADDMGMPP